MVRLGELTPPLDHKIPGFFDESPYSLLIFQHDLVTLSRKRHQIHFQVTNYYRAYSNVRFSGSDTCVLLATDMKHEGRSGVLRPKVVQVTRICWIDNKCCLVEDIQIFKFLHFQALTCSVSLSATQTLLVLAFG